MTKPVQQKSRAKATFFATLTDFLLERPNNRLSVMGGFVICGGLVYGGRAYFVQHGANFMDQSVQQERFLQDGDFLIHRFVARAGMFRDSPT